MKKKGKYAAVIILLIIAVTVAGKATKIFADDLDFDMDYVQVLYNEKNGAYSSDVNTMLQSNDGTIYIGSSAGLISYNGREFKKVEAVNSEVNAIYEDSLGSLWVGTNDMGLYIISNGEVKIYDKSSYFDSNCIKAIATDNRAGVYVSTSGSVYHFDRRMDCARLDSEYCASTISLASNNNGVTAGVTKTGEIYFIDGGEVKTGFADAISANTCTGVDFISGSFWFSTYEGEIIQTQYETSGVSCQSQTISGMTGINRIWNDMGRIWVLADNGIGYYENDDFIYLSLDELGGYYQQMFCDYEGNYWIASSMYGILKMARNDFRYISKKVDRASGVVNTTLVDGDLLYTGMDTGLVIINKDTLQTVDNTLTRILEGVKINCIIKDSSGNIWIATYGSRYGLLKYKSGNCTVYNHENGMPTDSISFVKEIDSNTVIAVTKNGIVTLKNGKIVSQFDKTDGFSSADILDAQEIPEKGILFCTDGDGMFLWNDGKIISSMTVDNGLTSDVVRRIVPYGEGYLLVTGNGLCYLEGDTIKRLQFSFSGMYDVLKGNDDALWILSNSGIYRINASRLMSDTQPEYELYNYDRGFQETLTANAWTGVDNSDNAYLCCQNGVVSMSFNSSLTDRSGYKVSINMVYADDEKIPVGTYADIPKTASKVAIEPVFSKFGYDKLNITYYLEGYDKDITVVDASQLPDRIVYNNLPGGEYVFRIQLSDNNGKLISSANLTINKDMLWYEMDSVKISIAMVAGLVLILIGDIILRVRIDSIEKKKNVYRNITKQTVMAIAKTIDAKDEYTNGHSLRVANYSMEIAKRYGMSPEEQEDIYYCGLLHDIGKIGIPDEILNKSSRLTDEEYEIIKTHPAKGAEILSDVTTIPHIVEGAKYHHERYDGSGYNEGLKGNEIPLFARIIAVADTFDAMTSSRCYQVQRDKEYVVEELKRVSGKQLDPTFVNIMLTMILDGTVEIK